MKTKKSRSKKPTKSRRAPLTSRELQKLGTSVAQEQVGEIVETAEHRGVSLPLDGDNIDTIKAMAAKAVSKWDDLSWDHQDAFFLGWSRVMRDRGVVR